MKPKNPVFKVATLEDGEPILPRYIEAADELEALKQYVQLEINSGNSMIGCTVKVLPDGMVLVCSRAVSSDRFFIVSMRLYLV